MMRPRRSCAGVAIAKIAALGVLVGHLAGAGCTNDRSEFSDYDRLSARARECGPIRTTVRGRVGRMLSPDLFRVTDDTVLGDGVWVLSHSRIHIRPGEYIVAHGTLAPGPPAAIEGRYAVELPDEVQKDVRDEGLFVAETLAAFPTGPP